tara:strand:- start:1124 stop:1870 length:747 start_codon:yes stop_codon:yes gene_type:complete
MVDHVNNTGVQSAASGVHSQGIYEESSYQNGPVGSLLELADGRRFRYARFAAAAAAGLLIAPDESAGALVETDGSMTAAAIGDTQVTVTATALDSVTKDQFAGAYMHITDDAGEGYQYRISGNSADGGSDNVVFDLYDGLVVAVTTASDCAIVANRWNGVVSATATDYNVSGVTARVMSSGYYGWVQTTGMAIILADGTIAVGDNLTLSDGVAGAIQLKDAETESLIGAAAYAPDTTGHCGVRLYGLE